MNKKSILKLALTLGVLAGSLSVGHPAKGLGCPTICCDPSCISVRHCFGRPGNCICEEACSIDINRD